MEKTNRVVTTPKAMAAFIRGAQAMPAPGGPDFDPRGPIGPIAYGLYRRLAGRLDAIALNPQPLPPQEVAARMIAQEFVASVVQLGNLTAALPRESAEAAGKHVASRIADFEEWCGTGRLHEKIAEILRKLGPRPIGGGDPPPHPNELANGILLATIGAELYAAGSAVQGLAAAGEKMMQQGLSQLG
ncbi:hypothetical protein [Pseudorhodoferax sp.]|uniref:hypothetical protein n=1 Tax=Pseudorhodoferax sp. TaxID=1993553 RepID=UPI0039E52B4A